MATSILRRLLVTSGKIPLSYHGYKALKSRQGPFTGFRWNQLRCHKKLLASTGLSISYGLLGFNLNQKSEEEEVDPVTKKYREARVAHGRQDLKVAEQCYHDTLKLADDQHKKKEMTDDKHVTARTMAYDGLADIALQTGQLEAAEALFKETLKGCLQQGLSEDHNVIVEISLKLASIYAMQQRKEEAESGYKFCLAMQQPKIEALEAKWISQDASKKEVKHADLVSKDGSENKEQDTAVLLGMSLGSYGRYLMYEKRYQEALPMFERSRVFCKNTMGTDTNQYAVILNDIATLYIVTKNFEKAENLLTEGIALSEKCKLAEMAVLHCNMGALHLRRGDYDEACKACEKGREFAKIYDHKLAYRNAEACLKKVAEVKADKEKKNSAQKEKEKAA